MRVCVESSVAHTTVHFTDSGFPAVRFDESNHHMFDCSSVTRTTLLESSTGINAARAEDGVTFGARVDSYQALRVDPRRGMTIGVLDYEGELEVREPSAFLLAIRDGFGRAKAFGCGLMMIRRA